jgi:hypothetical protein
MAINTLITIKDAITDFAVGHGQLQGRVIFEADDHRSAYITEENTYPLLFVAPIDVAVNRAMNVHTLRVYVYERINDDRLDVWENANDTSLILRDIRVWWNDYGVDDINIVEDPIGQFGCDKELDNLVGYFADIRFEIPSHGRCTVPVNATPIPTPSCADATQVIEDSLGNQLYSNAIPSGVTETQVIQDSTAVLKDTLGATISTTPILAEGSEDITAPDSTYLVEYVNGTDIQSGSILSGGSVTVTVPNPIVCANTTLEVNGTTEGTVTSGATVDIQLSDSGGVVTPTSVTQVGNDFQVVLPDAPTPTPRSTATLIKTGQTTSYRTGDDGDTEAGRATSFLVLDTAPLHNSGAATINTTTNRFTDILGGQTYATAIVLDWSTWNGTTLLAYSKTNNGANVVWNTAIDSSLSRTIGTFSSGWRLTNRKELENIVNESATTGVLNYAPFSLNTDLNYWTSTTPRYDTTRAWILGSNSTGWFYALAKSGANCHYLSCRTMTLSTSNVLS